MHIIVLILCYNALKGGILIAISDYSSLPLVSSIHTGLAHCRHLKTVRTHLSGLVLHRIFPVDQPFDASKGLTTEVWAQMCKMGTVSTSYQLNYHFLLALNVRVFYRKKSHYWLLQFLVCFLALYFCLFCVVIRFFHPRHNGQ